jgi:hypothetical protein
MLLWDRTLLSMLAKLQQTPRKPRVELLIVSGTLKAGCKVTLSYGAGKY